MTSSNLVPRAAPSVPSGLRIILAGLTLSLLAAPASAMTQEEFFKGIGFQSSDWISVVVLMTLVAAGLIALPFFFRFKSEYFDQRHELAKKNRELQEQVRSLQLTHPELDALHRLQSRAGDSDPAQILTSHTLFEKCLGAEVDAIFASGVSNEEMRELDVLLHGLRRKLGFSKFPYDKQLTSSRDIDIGQRVTIYRRDSRAPMLKKTALSDSSEFHMTISFEPPEKPGMLPAAGDAIRMAFSRQNDGFYGMELVIATIDKDQFTCRHTLQLKRSQLRQNTRVDVKLPLKFRLVTTRSPETSEIARGEITNARIWDISSGGLSFMCEKSLKPGDVVSLNFTLSTGVFTGVTARVIHISLQEGKHITLYRHHIQFLNLESSRADHIVRFVFERQLHQSQWR